MGNVFSCMGRFADGPFCLNLMLKNISGNMRMMITLMLKELQVIVSLECEKKQCIYCVSPLDSALLHSFTGILNLEVMNDEDEDFPKILFPTCKFV